MARTKQKYTVPKNEQKEFDLLVQRANRRLKANMNLINMKNITSETAQRALAGDYLDKSEWKTQKTPFSRSKTFDSEKDYKQFMRHISQWGGDDFTRSEEQIKERYVKNIIRALTTTALDNGNAILTEKTGQLPGRLAKQIRELSLEQLTNFFDHADPTETIELQGWGSDVYVGVDKKEFVDITRAHINALKEMFPDNSSTTTKAKPKKGRKKSKSKKTSNKSKK